MFIDACLMIHDYFMIKQSLSVVLLAALMLGGAGCWKKKTETPQTQNQDQQTSQQPSQEKPNPKTPKEAVLGAITSFRDVKYFKARYTIPLEQGTGNGNLSFIKPDRMRVTMSAPGVASSEMIRVGESYFIKIGTGAWQDISGTSAAKQSYEAMNQALAQGDKMEGADSLEVKSQFYDKVKQCDLYTTEFKGQDGKSATVLICVSGDGMPQYFELPSNGGKIHLEYYDIGVPFLIEKPM